MTDNAERIANAEQAQAALTRWLDPAFDHLVGEWTLRMSDIAATTPWETDKIKNLAIAVRAAKEARAQIHAVVVGGQVAREDMKRQRQIENLSPERRKVLGIPV